MFINKTLNSNVYSLKSQEILKITNKGENYVKRSQLIVDEIIQI